jgi:hypothetical protein
VKSKKYSDEEKGGVSKMRHVRFDLQALGSRGQEEPRRKACKLNLPTVTTDELNVFAAQRSAVTEHTKVHESVLRHEPTTGPHPSLIVTRYDADSPEASIDWQIDEKNPHVPERDSTDVSAERHIRCP